jgi:hypothetical protein
MTARGDGNFPAKAGDTVYMTPTPRAFTSSARMVSPSEAARRGWGQQCVPDTVPGAPIPGSHDPEDLQED